METRERQDRVNRVDDFAPSTGDVSRASPQNVNSRLKQPPPESATSIRTRGLVILSFWAVAILLGFPTWYWTTSIYRARLPLQEMLDWADGKACKPSFPLAIAIEAPSLSIGEAQHLVRTTQHAIDDLNEFSAHHLRLQLAQTSLPLNASHPAISHSTSNTHQGQSTKEDVALTVKLLPQDASVSAKAILQPHSTTYDIHYAPSHVPSTSSSSSSLANYIAAQLQELFAEEQATIAYVLTSQSTSHSSSTPTISQQAPAIRDHRSGIRRVLPPELAARLASRMTRSLKYAPTYHITISLFTPLATPSTWEIEDALQEYFEPLLSSISQISNFTVDTQVQLHAAFSHSVQQPQYDENLKVWVLREEDLSGFINAAEWPLSPSIGAGPTLNFILYVPNPANSPLVVKGSQATSWLIPQWGGVAIINPPVLSSSRVGVPSTLSKAAIEPALLTFSHQLLSLLGAPQSPASLPLQLRTLTRVRAATLLLSASATMGSLARLTVALPSIAIPETVFGGVETTLAHLQCSCDALRKGDFRAALGNARVAEAEAETAFFEKSMVGQVYFPEEHKVAVYLPLLGPVGVPLVMSALKEVKRLWIALKATRKPA